MIKRFFAGLCILTSAMVFSQESNSSPYSYYGIGDQKFKGTAESRAMGALGIVADSIHLNLQNPASYNTLQFTTFNVGVSNTGTSFKTNNEEDSANRSTLDYLAISLPFNKIGVSFGLMPYTSVGYRIQNTSVDADFARDRRFTGKGGLNRAYAGAAYNIFKGFSLGADLQYFFGNVDTKSIIGIPTQGVQYLTREINETNYRGFSVNLGAMYTTKVSDKLNIQTSATYTPESKLDARTQRGFATIAFNGNNDEIVIQEIASPTINEKITIAPKYSFGAGIGDTRKWFAGAEFSGQGANKLANRFDDVTNAGFESSYRVSAGGYYIPNYASFTSYFSRVTYRAGLRYEKTGLVIGGESINDMGLNLGLGLPIGGFASNLNLGVEMGKRGTTNAGLVQENYLSVFVSLSFNDKWFAKRKYD